MLTPTPRRDEGWLAYSAPLVSPLSAPPFSLITSGFARDRAALLEWSARLPGNCKLARSAERELVVRAELPARFESPRRVAAIETGFAAIVAGFDCGDGSLLCEADPPLREAPDLASLCVEVGWAFEQREGGTLAVDLDVPGAYLPALIASRADAVSIELEIVALPEAPGIRRAALVELLLRANGAFRMVRAVVSGSPPQARLEVVLPGVPGAEEVGDSLAALAVAARHCAREARLIASDEAIAHRFLERSGMLPPPE